MVSVLIVEDDPNKLSRIKRVFDDLDRGDVVTHDLGNTTDAIKWLQGNHCDVLVLDLHIPLRHGEDPRKQGGEQLIRKLLRADSQCSIPSQAVGLTAYEELRDEFRSHFEREGWVIAKYDQTSKEWEETVANTVRREAFASKGDVRRGVLLALHGIRTTAEWHRTLADVAQAENWICPIQHMWYGRFSVFQFLSPFARTAKIGWFRTRYTETIRAYEGRVIQTLLPSVVAHSFGTLILGNALTRFKDIRVDSVILCGSILPRDFPWDTLIANGQVQRVLHDIGRDDKWAKICSFVVPGTGSSGRDGFSTADPQLVEEVHNLSHNEYFDALQMQKHWFAFLNTVHARRKAGDSGVVPVRRGDHPWLSPIVSVAVVVILLCVLSGMAYLAAKIVGGIGDYLIEIACSWFAVVLKRS